MYSKDQHALAIELLNEKKPEIIFRLFLFGALDRIRTCDLSLRRGSRYPAVPRERKDIILN